MLTEREIPYAKWSPERENALTLIDAVPSEESKLGYMCGRCSRQLLHVTENRGTYIEKDFPSRAIHLGKIWEGAVFGAVDD